MAVPASICCERESCPTTQWHPDLHRKCGRSNFQPALTSEKLTLETLSALRAIVESIKQQVEGHKNLSGIPTELTANVRNDMYLASESFRVIRKHKLVSFRPDDGLGIGNYEHGLDRATKFIPTWVKVAVALALGLGTMVGWKRIVIRVGERIGKQHLTYAQGAASEVVAMFTILAADRFGLPSVLRMC